MHSSDPFRMTKQWLRRKLVRSIAAIAVLGAVAVFAAAPTARAQAPTKPPNIMFIMADDSGGMRVGAAHRGMGIGETPNIDRFGNGGALFPPYYPMQACPSGRTPFFPGMYPLRTGMIPPQLPGSPSYLRPG